MNGIGALLEETTELAKQGHNEKSAVCNPQDSPPKTMIMVEPSSSRLQKHEK